MGIRCTLCLSGSDSVQYPVTLDVLPREGESLVIGDTSNVIVSVQHVIDPKANEHQVFVIFDSGEQFQKS